MHFYVHGFYFIYVIVACGSFFAASGALRAIQVL